MLPGMPGVLVVKRRNKIAFSEIREGRLTCCGTAFDFWEYLENPLYFCKMESQDDISIVGALS